MRPVASRCGSGALPAGACAQSGLKAIDHGLSKHWRVDKRHVGFYTGGPLQYSQDERLFVCLSGTDLAVCDSASGTVTKFLQRDSKVHAALHGGPREALRPMCFVGAARSLCQKTFARLRCDPAPTRW